MAKARNLLSLLTAASLAAFSATKPLKTTTSKLMTVEGPHGSDGALLINVLRTDDLIADKIPSKPLLLEKISHLLIRVELSPTKCSINGHSLPLTPSDSKEMVKAGKVQEEVDPKTGSVKLKMMVEMKQVQTLKLPKDSPLVPLGLTSPELLKISDKYIAEGVIGAMLSVSEEPLEVEAATVEGDKLDAQAYKVTIGIQILEIDGVILSTTDLPSIDLLQLIVHPDPLDSSKVVSITTLTPDALKGAAQVTSTSDPADHYATSLMRGLEASLLSAFDMFASMMKKVTHNSGELDQAPAKTQQRKCRMGRPHHSGHHRVDSEALPSVPVESKPVENQALAQASPAMTYEPKHHFTPTCLLAMLWRSVKSGPTVFRLGIPALILLGLVFAATKLAARIRYRREQKVAAAAAMNDEAKALLGYQDMAEEKAGVVVVVTSPPSA